MAQKLYTVSVNGAMRQLPCNTPILLDINGKQLRVVLHELSEPGTKKPAGFTATRHIDLTPVSDKLSIEQQFDELVESLQTWVLERYVGPEDIRDLLERGITLSDQAEARKMIEAKEPSDDAVALEANKLNFADFAGDFRALYTKAYENARAAMPQTGVDPQRLFTELLGL